jgi:hypothetical protein
MASAPGPEIRTMATLPDPGATAVAMAAMVSNPWSDSIPGRESSIPPHFKAFHAKAVEKGLLLDVIETGFP